MREFFNGWRRKVGVATLLMACVLMGFWSLSCDGENIVTVIWNGQRWISLEQSLFWIRLPADYPEEIWPLAELEVWRP